MKRSRKSELDAVWERAAAEDRVVAYLDKLPGQIALATAVAVEAELARRWENEKIEMIRRGDRREVFLRTSEDIAQMHGVRDMVPPGTQSDHTAEQHIIEQLLAAFPIDQAWWIANGAARSAAHFWAPRSDPPSLLALKFLEAFK